jgi:hypothetical protein
MEEVVEIGPIGLETGLEGKRKRRTKKEVNDLRKSLGLTTYSETKVVVKKSRGRPRKLSIVANTDKARQQQLLAALLNSKGEHIISQIINKALDPEDKDQIACMKMCIDRILPMSYFDKSKEVGNKGVQITIVGVGQGTEPLLVNTSSNEHNLLEEEEG